VIGHEQRALPPVHATSQRHERQEVVVVAELLRLGGERLVVEVELGCARNHRVSPGDHDGLLEAIGYDHLVEFVRLNRGPVQLVDASRAGAVAAATGFGAGPGDVLRVVRLGSGRRGARKRRAETNDECARRAALEHRAAGQCGFDNVAEVRVGTGVGDRVIARVATAEQAGHPGPATMPGNYGKQASHRQMSP
jgi:hypothetical protein